MRHNKKLAGMDGALVFYAVIALALIVLASLGGCARTQAVIVNPNIEPPRTELMQESRLPAPDTTEKDSFKRCVKNLAKTRDTCAQNADNHNGLRKYVKKAVPSAKEENHEH